MEEKGRAVCPPRLLDLIPNGRDSGGGGGGAAGSGFGVAEEKKLELRLGPPGGEECLLPHSSVLSLGHFSKVSKSSTSSPNGAAKRGFLDAAKTKPEGTPASGERNVAFASGGAAGANTASQTRTTSVPVVGWPPVRTFRKNLASSSSKPSTESPNELPKAETGAENCKKGFFVKINMDGIPIGRKIDLKAYNSYERLSSAVLELFRGLLAAQRNLHLAGVQDSSSEDWAFTGLLDGSGEYTLVYEDNEGDRMLVGDIPWDMFVSTVKRLRVLKTSELTALSSKAVSRKRTAEC